MSYYAVIRGPLGVGKTTVARAVTAAIHGHLVSIDSILDRHGLEEWEGGYISVRSFLRANDFAISEAEPLLSVGTPVVLDGNFYHRAAIDDLERRLAFPHEVFTLTAPVSDCIERDRHRAPSFGEEAVREVFAKVSEVEYGVVVDARQPLADTVTAIVRRLDEVARPPPTMK